MNFNFQKARYLMVENQLRPNKIKDPIILDIFKKVPKENFLFEGGDMMPYSDSDIFLGDKRGYLKNLNLAQLIHYSEINSEHRVLHLGALTGYVTALLAGLSKEVVAVEPNEKFNLNLKKNIDDLKITNIQIAKGSLKEGVTNNYAFDRIFIDTPIRKLDDKIIGQLSGNLGKIIMIKKENEELSKAIKITKNIENLSSEYLFDVFSKFELYQNKEEFEF